MKRGESGVLLLEMLAAIAVLGFAGLALVEFLASGSRATVEARVRERKLADQERLIAEVGLLGRPELDQLVATGRRQAGPLFVEVRLSEPGLYRVAVGRLEAPAVEDLVTVVWRAR